MVDETENRDSRFSIFDCRLNSTDESGSPTIDNRQSTIDNSSSGGLVFWTLILMGLSTFTPCVILPEWRDYQAARVAEQRAQHRLDQLRRTVERERSQLEAVQNDPAVVARIAQRDLGFRRVDSTVVAVDVQQIAAEEGEESFVPQAVTPPEWISRATSLLPDLDYDAIFCDDRMRLVVMLMSVSLIVVSAVLFQRRNATE
jgi:cell division protein FtsB